MGAPVLLAIVIPAFKPDFLELALASISLQAPGQFRVYVGDDASPADISGICDRFRGKLDIRYVRFTTNFGRNSLVAQWNRCIHMTTEPWVWLFSDDDIMEPGCVGRLLEAIRFEGDKFDLFHFGVTVIDAAGEVLKVMPDFPAVLPAHRFAAARLRFELSSYAPDYAFSRSAFDRVGGFIDFPLAWCSDDATWIAMAGTKGIRSLEGPRVRWRLSGQNISSRAGATVARKMQAQLMFILWLDAHLRRPQMGLPAGEVNDVMAHTPSWFYRQVRNIDGNFWRNGGWRMAWQLRHLQNHGFLRDSLRMLAFDIRCWMSRPK